MTFECIECTMLPYLLLFNGGTWNQMGKKFSGSWKAVYCHNDTIFVTSIGVARGWEEILLKKGQSEVRLSSLVAGAWTEREKMYHGGSFLKLADDDMDIQNPEAQNRELGGF